MEDSSYWNNSSGSSTSLQYSEGFFDYAKYVTSEITLPLDNCFFNSKESFTLEWRELVPPLPNKSTVNKVDYNYSACILLDGYNYFTSWSLGEFAHYALIYDGSSYSFFVNGVSKKIYSNSPSLFKSNDFPAGFSFYNDKLVIKSQYFTYYDQSVSKTISCFHKNTYIDEMRLSKGILYTGNFSPQIQPFDTNEVLVIPDDAADGSVLFFTRYDYNDYRIGGVRPTYPTDGYIYVAVEEDVVQSVQQYQVNHWEEIDAFLYNSGQVTDLKNYNLSGNKVTEPEEPKPDNGNSPGTGSGNNTGDNKEPSGDEDEKFDFWGAVGDLLGGVIDFLGAILGLLGKLVGLFKDIVTGLFDFLEVFTGFGSEFTDFLVAVFPFIPAEVWKLIGAGISAMILVGIIKLIRG